MKFPIKKEFAPFSWVSPPVQNPKMAGWMGSQMRPPRWVRVDGDDKVSVTRLSVRSYDGAEIPIFSIEPRSFRAKRKTGTIPCLVYYHGGGFFFEGAGYHYTLAKRYALECGCRVLFAQYRLAPKHPHPTPAEDCYAALRFAFESAAELRTDAARIAVGGDSAGGALAAAVCQMARDRGTDAPLFQLLVYPVTDRRMETESCRLFTHTPMWNSRLSEKMWEGYVPNTDAPDVAYASPMEATRFDALPPAYVETAEFDCLRDEGIAYAKALQSAGVDVTLNETRGTMHGFDIVKNAPTSKEAVAARIAFMRDKFHPEIN